MYTDVCKRSCAVGHSVASQCCLAVNVNNYTIFGKMPQKRLKFTMADNDIIIKDTRDFDIRQTLDCGQIFRYSKIGENSYEVFSKDKRCVVTQEGVAVISSDDAAYWHRFFDLDNDYGAIKNALRDKPFMKDAVEYGGGIRILNQDPFEMLISFIVSANNHIPRIKGILSRMCEGLGEKMDGYYAFPTPEAMAAKDADYYASIGAGYRAEYLSETAKAVADGFDLSKPCYMDGDAANKYLCTLKGVGPKVADCILLFAYHKSDVFPVDTWIKKVYADMTGKDATNKEIRKYLISEYGNLSGYAQQYLFFNKRDN